MGACCFIALLSIVLLYSPISEKSIQFSPVSEYRYTVQFLLAIFMHLDHKLLTMFFAL